MGQLRIVVATGNRDKLAELGRLLAHPALEVVGIGRSVGLELPEEDGRTLEENALKKARYAARATGLLSVADDTGLEVDALGGEPGVLSARLAGPGATYDQNRCALLERLGGVGQAQRGATFRCVIAMVGPGGWSRTVEGACRGVILPAPRGRGGFGYDPLFFVPELGKTFAELGEAEKDRVSHRGEAARKALGVLLARHDLR